MRGAAGEKGYQGCAPRRGTKALCTEKGYQGCVHRGSFAAGCFVRHSGRSSMCASWPCLSGGRPSLPRRLEQAHNGAAQAVARSPRHSKRERLLPLVGG